MFHLRTTPGYERDVRSATKNNALLLDVIEMLLDVLEQDPYNKSRQYNIKKLTDVKAGDGQWRIRAGKFRLRYDIIGQEVILYSFRHRKEAY